VDRSKLFTNAKKLDSHNEGMPLENSQSTSYSGQNTLGGNLSK